MTGGQKNKLKLLLPKLITQIGGQLQTMTITNLKAVQSKMTSTPLLLLIRRSLCLSSHRSHLLERRTLLTKAVSSSAIGIHLPAIGIHLLPLLQQAMQSLLPHREGEVTTIGGLVQLKKKKICPPLPILSHPPPLKRILSHHCSKVSVLSKSPIYFG